MEYKTSEAQRKAVKSYSDRCDRVNVLFPAGTKARMQDLGIESYAAFIKKVVLSALEKMEENV